MFDLFFNIAIVEVLIFFGVIFFAFHIFPYVGRHFKLTERCFLLFSIYISFLLAIAIFLIQEIPKSSEETIIEFVDKNTTQFWRCCINISNLLINNNFSKICKNYN